MNVSPLVLSLIVASIGCANCAEPKPRLYTREQLEAFVDYLVDNEKGAEGKIPIQLDSRDVIYLTVFFGDPKVYPRRDKDESALRITLWIRLDERDTWSYVYQVTVEPTISREERSNPNVDWAELLSKRRVTQYHITETRVNEGDGVFRLVKLLAKR